jgi:NitT/TauT family transport system ATP-binding protein
LHRWTRKSAQYGFAYCTLRMTGFVEIENVTHAYGGLSSALAVDKLTLSIAEGEFAAVVGPSGCG